MPRPVISALTTLAALFALAPLPVAAGPGQIVAASWAIAPPRFRISASPNAAHDFGWLALGVVVW